MCGGFVRTAAGAGTAHSDPHKCATNTSKGILCFCFVLKIIKSHFPFKWNFPSRKLEGKRARNRCSQLTHIVGQINCRSWYSAYFLDVCGIFLTQSNKMFISCLKIENGEGEGTGIVRWLASADSACALWGRGIFVFINSKACYITLIL